MSVRQGVNTIAGAVGKYPLNERNITNCITEIPQDIKLELNNGTLTLKAGSKVYVPNGAGVFDELVIQNDITLTSTLNRTAVLVINTNNMGIAQYADSMTFSGNTAPSGQQYMQWYDTANNLVKQTNNSGSTWTSGFSLPFAMVTITSAGIQSIDQVFNGFGYIGSTVFALPGVKALIPNGRNADGTLKNIEVSVSTVKTRTLQYDSEQIWNFYNSTGSISGDTINPDQSVYFIKNLKNMYGLGITSGYNKCYVEETNLWYQNADTSTWTVTNMCLFAHTRSSSLKITSFNSKTDFHAIDYNDTNFIAHQASPSGTSVNLTLGASGTSYKAQEDGWILINGLSTADNVYNFVRLTAGGLGSICWNSSSGNTIEVSLPVSKGQTFSVYYNQFSVSDFKFYYANGAA